TVAALHISRPVNNARSWRWMLTLLAATASTTASVSTTRMTKQATHRGSSQIAQSRRAGIRPRAGLCSRVEGRPCTGFRPRIERTASTSACLAATSALNLNRERDVSPVSRIAAMRTAERQNSATERDKLPISLAHRALLTTLRGSLPDALPGLSDISELRPLAFVFDYAARLDS